jgi:ribosomal protein S18 acetylase RimI-like enzyme
MAMATVHQFSRRAVAGDLPAILRIDHAAASGDRERAEFLRHCLDLGECHVCLGDEVVAGFVIVKPAHFFGRDFVELLEVDPARRRSGTGRILLREALATAGTAQVFTSTNRSNRPMRALLDAEDWSFSGELGGLDEGDPELVFYQNRPVGPGVTPADLPLSAGG